MCAHACMCLPMCMACKCVHAYLYLCVCVSVCDVIDQGDILYAIFSVITPYKIDLSIGFFFETAEE